MDDRARALEEIAALARRHGLGAAEIAAALGEEGPSLRAAAGERRRGVLVRVLAYLGGTFVFAGIGTFIALHWDGMGSAARVVLTLGSGMAAYVLAVLGCRDARFERAGPPLFLVAGALEPTGMFVAFGEYGSGGDWRIANLVVSATMAAQFGTTFGVVRRSTPLFLLVTFATLFWWTAFDLIDVDGNVTALTIGGMLLIAAAGLSRTPHRDITPVWYFIGGAAFLGGLFDLLDDTPVDILFVGAAAALVYLSAVLQSRTLLCVSTLAILAYTGWFTAEHFADSVGWPVALVAFGLVMIALSALAVRIDRKYVRRQAQ